MTQRQPVARLCATASEPELQEEETFTYQAEVDRLMDMIVNSLYSNREVFLRELISNCSDALDKVRFVSLTKPEVMEGNDKLEIRVKADPKEKTIMLEDSGIGMTKDDLSSQLGTIARSGTRKFMEAIKESKGDASLIGQFGVGFYSSFLVADKVTVQTKSPDDSHWVWESNAGSHQYSIRPDADTSLIRGTRITLHLKEDAAEYADSYKLKTLLKQYSEFIAFPIQLYATESVPKKVVDEDATTKKQAEEDTAAEKESREKKKVDPVLKTEYEDVWDYRLQNDNKPLWTRNPKDLEKSQYDSFFKATFGDFLEPVTHSHFNVEGTIEFSALLFIPGMAPFEDEMANPNMKSRNIKLYVKRVFISDEFDDLMPKYLNFVKGVVDSSDLPLNVSREILQENRIVRVIKKQLIRRSLDMIEELTKRESPNDFNTFYESFGKRMKMGVIEDSANRDRIAGFLRFASSKSGDSLVGFDEYIENMKEGQKNIFYIAADTKKQATSMPFLERLRKKDLEVLYLLEPIDEVTLTNLTKYKDFDFVDVSKEELEFPDEEEEKEEAAKANEEFAVLTQFMSNTLGEKVEKVSVSNRLDSSPCIVVTSKFGWSANMERIMRTQTMGDSRAMEYMKGKKIMEINPDHPMIKGINEEVRADKKSSKAKVLTEVLYETALLTSGFVLESPSEYAEKVYQMLSRTVDGASNGSAVPTSDKSEASNKSEGSKKAEATETITPEVVRDGDGDDPWKM